MWHPSLKGKGSSQGEFNIPFWVSGSRHTMICHPWFCIETPLSWCFHTCCSCPPTRGAGLSSLCQDEDEVSTWKHITILMEWKDQARKPWGYRRFKVWSSKAESKNKVYIHSSQNGKIPLKRQKQNNPKNQPTKTPPPDCSTTLQHSFRVCFSPFFSASILQSNCSVTGLFSSFGRPLSYFCYSRASTTLTIFLFSFATSQGILVSNVK